MGKKLIAKLEDLKDFDRGMFGRVVVAKFKRLPTEFFKTFTFDHWAAVYFAADAHIAHAEKRKTKPRPAHRKIRIFAMKKMTEKLHRSKRERLAF